MTTPELSQNADRRGRWYRPDTLMLGIWARPKLVIAVATAAVTYAAIPYLPVAGLDWSARAAGAWNAGALVYILIAFWLMSSCSSAIIQERARREDESRFVILTVILLAIASSFTAVLALIGAAKSATGVVKVSYLALAGLTVLTSWLVMQVVFTLHYAHAYFQPLSPEGAPARGLVFPGDEVPDYWDFLYFTTSIGATSQTSDVSIVAKTLRRQATLQAVVAFVFNTTILALAINLASGMIGG